jgi:hypothetical protein
VLQLAEYGNLLDAGINWNPLSDYLPQIGVSGIAVDHTNSNVIYIATGR